MNTYIYIFTDSNRTSLHVGLSEANQETAPHVHNLLSGFSKDPLSTLPRVVYKESLASEEIARKRFEELSRYTRMQKERLIRRHNPNWMNLLNGSSSQKAATRRACVTYRNSKLVN